jgi:hypothetical protein
MTVISIEDSIEDKIHTLRHHIKCWECEWEAILSWDSILFQCPRCDGWMITLIDADILDSKAFESSQAACFSHMLKKKGADYTGLRIICYRPLFTVCSNCGTEGKYRQDQLPPNPGCCQNSSFKVANSHKQDKGVQRRLVYACMQASIRQARYLRSPEFISETVSTITSRWSNSEEYRETMRKLFESMTSGKDYLADTWKEIELRVKLALESNPQE